MPAARPHRSRGDGRRARRRPSLAAAVSLLALAGSAGADPDVRVLLVETRDPVRVADRVLRAGPGGVLDGDRPLGRAFRLAGPGPHQVGSLAVRGALEVAGDGSGLRVVNRVPLEDYVAGTLGREVYHGWHEETLRAQAVVSRTYALHRRSRQTGRPFDLEAGTAAQVYGGVDAETPRIRAAVADTSREILLHGGSPILAAFHSASGGQTESAEAVWGEPLPYLVSRPVPHEEDSPDTYWRARVTGTTLGRALAPLGLRLGPIQQVSVVDRSPSGRAVRVRVTGTEGSETLSGRALRNALGDGLIRSTLFEVRTREDVFTFVGSGHGHGVGMSQWGAQAMAQRGATYQEILAAFYPGAELARVDTR